MKRLNVTQQATEEKTTLAEPKRLNLLTAIEQIVELSEGSNLSEEFYVKARRYVRYVAKKLSLTPVQAVLFSLFVDKSDDSCIRISDFATHLRCRTVRIIRYMSDIDVLEKRKLVICCRQRREKTYRISMPVIEALKENRFVVEVDRVVFKYGDVAYVNTNTNFILVDEDEGSVQVAFNTPYSGPNGIGGVTVDGRVSGIKFKESKKGKINYNFSVQGTGISAQIFLTLSAGSNQATVTITPNFNSRTLTLYGEIVPLEQSSVFKGRSL